MLDKRLIPVFAVVFLDTIAAGLVVPLLPYFAQELGADVSTIGLIGSVFGFAQLIGSPIMGRLGDKYGRKPLLLVSLIASGFSYVLLGTAKTLIVFVLSRLPVGFLKQTGTLSEGVVADIGAKSQRAEFLGYLGISMGVGLIIGPPLGGYLSSVYGLQWPAFLSGIVYLLSITVVWLGVPDIRRKGVTVDGATDAGFTSEESSMEQKVIDARLEGVDIGHVEPCPIDDKDNSIAHRVIRFLREGELWVLCVTRLGNVLAAAMFMKSLPLITASRFGFSARDNGLLIGYMGLVHAVVQGFAIRPLTRRFCDCQLITYGMVGMAVSLLAISMSNTWYMMVIALAPMRMANGVLNTVLTSSLSKRVSPENIGGILGISGSVTSFSGALAPYVGALLLQHVSEYGPSMFGAILCAILAATVKCSMKIESVPSIPDDKKIE